MFKKEKGRSLHRKRAFLTVKICEHLICPDCQGKLEMREKLICRSCGRIFSHNDHFLNLLPTNLIQADLAEEHFWMTDARQGVKAHPLISLMVSRDPILYFYEQILPKLELQGNILEIGSGSCWLSSFVKSAFPQTYIVATDVAPSALRKGTQISEFLGCSIDKFMACKVECLPFESRFFDYVIGSAILHHSCPQEAIRQIFRVLKHNGTYIGIGELAIPRILGLLWGSRFGLAGRREKELGVKEGNYSFSQWKKFFYNAGFKEVKFILERDPQYKQHWFINLYYKVVSRIPEVLVRHGLASSITIIACR